MNRLKSYYKRKKYSYSIKINTRIYYIKCWILEHIIKDDVVEEYSIDKELLYDYYNEAHEDDYYHDYD